ncbi:MAG TPA: hypothetical protein VNT75_02955 [Symbiobacteriaceae bacterium]|nr:hypothetical protein [Symbiobacteriaceae bacterium]
MIPPIEPLRRVHAALQAGGVVAALGGSGLLYSLGLVDTVRDWDLTTDAPFDQVKAALGDLPWRPSPTGDGSYATAHRINVTPDGADIDLMVSWAVRCDEGVVQFPTVVAGALEGIPVGSPEVWAVAYRLIGRPQKAGLLDDYLRRHGYRSEIRDQLLAQPLPETARTAIQAW